MTLRKLTLISCAAVALSAAAQYTPPVVIEEGTGEWCKWCVKGIVAIDELTTAHPDNFIAIAIHYNDEFEMLDYTINSGFNTFPVANANRIYKQIDVSTDIFNRIYKDITEQTARGTITLNASLDGNGNVVAETVSTFGAEATKNINVAIVLTEDHLVGLYQANAFADGYNGEMGGWENLPERVPYYIFSHVARSIYPEYAGEFISDGAAEGDVFNKTFTVPIPESVKEPRNLSAIALLLNNGRIIGAQKVALCDQVPVVVKVNLIEGYMSGPKEVTATLNITNPDTENNAYSFCRFVLVAEDATETALKPVTLNLNPAQAIETTIVSVTGKIKDGKYNVRIEASDNGIDWKDTGVSFDVTAGNDAIEVVETQATDSPARWFNMQGVEVTNPTPGNVYIRILGEKASKIRI